jgi:TRAP-type C4-dicarboxylate transport system substrate-binding protein
MIKKGLFITLILLVGLLIAGCGTTEQTPAAENGKAENGKVESITLRYAHFMPQGIYISNFIEDFAAQVEESTGGRVKVDVYPAGTLLTPQNIYDGVLQGLADIGFGAPANEPGRFPLLTLMELPIGFQNSTIATKVFNDLVEEFEHDFLKDFKVVSFFGSPPMDLMTKSKVESLADVQGLEVRGTGSINQALSALGLVPITMDAGQMMEAFETGIIKGVVTGKVTVKQMNLPERHIDYVINYPIGSSSLVALMNRKVFESLSADDQKAIEEAGAEFINKMTAYADNDEKENLKWMVEQGVEVINLSAEEKAKWDAAVQPVIEKNIAALEAQGLPARKFVERMFELKKKYEKEFQ